MKIDEFLKYRRMSQAEFAEQLGIARQTVWNYISGKRCPAPHIALKIKEISKGKISLEEIMEHGSKK